MALTAAHSSPFRLGVAMPMDRRNSVCALAKPIASALSSLFGIMMRATIVARVNARTADRFLLARR